MEDEEERPPSFAERARAQELRRAQVLAQGQADRAAKRADKAKQKPLNSAAEGYDPVEVARRRQEAIAAAQARKRGNALRRRVDDEPVPALQRAAGQPPASPPLPAQRHRVAAAAARDGSPPRASSSRGDSAGWGASDEAPRVSPRAGGMRWGAFDEAPRVSPPRLARGAPPPPDSSPPPSPPASDDDAAVAPMDGGQPLCARREQQQRRAAEADAANKEPETRRCLDKRTARMRYARHFAAAIAGYRARALSPARARAARPASANSRPASARPASASSGPRRRSRDDDDDGGGGGGGPPRAASVVVRCRPLLPHEAARGDFVAVSTDLPFRGGPAKSASLSGRSWVTVHECTMHADMVRMLHVARRYPCDAALGAACSEADVYARAAKPALLAALEGRGAVLFMFGQTGSGKTFTMAGFEERAAAELFAADEWPVMTYFEVCGKKAFDLLRPGDEDGEDSRAFDGARHELRLADTEVAAVVGAVVARPDGAAALLRVLARGRRRRATAATEINGGSSRSHAVCRLDLAGGGSLTLVDCAGSERNHDSMYHDADRRKESAEINQSLYALKGCIRAANAARRAARDPGRPPPPPPPFRSSALTRVLREAFTKDDAHLGVVATLSPTATDAEHSVATLRTVCELAGWSQRLVDACASRAAEVPKKHDALGCGAVGVAAGADGLPAPPQKWTPPQLAAFLRRAGDAGAAAAVDRLGLDGRTVARMSVLGVANSLVDDDPQRAKRVVDALRDEAARVDAVARAARARRRASAR
ncbi:P-loop containing nucleoside triphosphate hydrolase protein [Pelagophyceae sp. CCMP2097]|nr:P-loop containing nucleoside triphosphate hydrolase protein [Pelagophyceae sp. CCMP2097]